MNTGVSSINSILFSIFLLTICGVSAQNTIEPVCGTVATTESLAYFKSIKPQLKKYEQEYLNLITNRNSSSASISSVPIKAHIVRTSASTGGISVSDLNDAIANMNAFYANAFMEFYICEGINYIDDDDFYAFETNDEGNLTAPNNVAGLINIYFTDYIENSASGGSLCGYAYGPGGSDIILMKNDCATNGSTLPHEVGHFFSLIHTHGPSNSFLTDELVDGSNCNSKGDQICDTPADPLLSTTNVNLSCVYTGTDTDANSDLFAPDPTNVMSYSRKECRVNFSTQQYARIYATYRTVRNNFACPSLNVSFTTDATQDCGNALTVNFTDTSTGATSWQWDVDGDDVVDYTAQNPNHAYSPGTYTVTLTISDGTNTISKSFFELIDVGSPKSVPLTEDFETFSNATDGGWESIDTSGNGFIWSTISGETPSNDTGPLTDNTTSTTSGTYIYTEASGSNPGNVAEFISPCININSLNAELKFAYHMFGSSIGELHIDVETSSGYDDSIASIIGEQQTNQADPYLQKIVNLSAYANQTIRIRFRAIRGGNWDSDIAIDDMSITENTLSSGTKALAEIKIYPNPISSDIIHVKGINNGITIDYEVVDLIGQTLLSGKLLNQQLDMNNLTAGAYFLILKEGNSKIIKKFVKH